MAEGNSREVVTPSQCHVLVSRDDDGAVVTLAGALDAATVPSVHAILLDLIENKGERRITIDVSGATFIDSTGVGLVVGTHRQLFERGGALIILRPTPAALRMLEITGLVQVLDIRAT